MKHIKLLNEFINPRLPISKEELGLGIKPEDKLIINSETYYFLNFDEENNEIHVSDESGEEKIFNLDQLSKTWELSKINDQEVIVESKKKF
jgi:hypothetical protein